ncbi:hypothetical protein NU219Hw_g4584t1 [Hortaea werneckii]
MSTCGKKNPQQLRARGKGCNEDCLYRIASRLCRLEASGQSRASCEGNSSGVDKYCEPATTLQDTAAVSGGDTCKPGTCSTEATPNSDDDCCTFPAPASDSICAEDCCKPSGKRMGDYSDDIRTPVKLAPRDRTAASGPSTAEGIDVNAYDCCTQSVDKKDDSTEACCKSKKDQASTQSKGPDCALGCCDSISQRPRTNNPTCGEHLAKAVAQFESLIRQGKCLCQRLMEEMNFCCCSTGETPCTSHTSPSRSGSAISAQPSECKTELFQKTSTADAARDQTTQRLSEGKVVELPSQDSERAAAREHVVLNVAGMTCTGCSKKLTNVLHGISGLSNIKVTFVSGTAAFDLDLGTEQLNVEDIVPLIERQTGFKLSRVTSGWMHLDVLLEPSAVRHLEDNSPNGLVSVEKVRGKHCYRITYDPTLVGARDLLPPNVALAPPNPDSTLTDGKKRLVNMTLAFVLSATFTIPVVALNWSDNPVHRQTREITALVLATVPQIIAVPEFYAGAMKALIFSRMIEMDMLVVISITAAYFYSVVAFALYEAGISVKEAAFFETSSLLITLVLLGRLVAAFCRVRAVSAVSLRSLQAETTHIVQPDGAIVEIDARLLQFGDTIRIAPHTRIVTDVDVISGTSAVDESMLTGEADPVPKQAGDSLVAGTLNGPSVLEGRLRRLPGANSLTDIANLVENALGSKPRIQDLADKVASWFIPTIVALSIATLIIWLVISLRVRGENAGGAIGTAITYGIAILAISCPCALGLAVPMVLVIAGGVAARAGVVIKEADAIERGYRTTDVVFDKTGTLTKADLTVATVSSPQTRKITEDEALALTNNLVSGNNHPVSQAVGLYLKAYDGLEPKVNHVNSIPGAGIEAKWKSFTVKAGNPYWNATDTEPCVRDIIEAGMTAFSVTIDRSLVLAFGLHSQIRDEAASVVQALQRQNIRCHIVSGDTDKAVQGIASRVGIDGNNVASRHSPAQKMEFVKRLQSDGRIVLFCGDGTNDAVAIAQANVGVQIGTASDVTNGVCDVTLLGGLEGILALLGISKRAFSRITFNFVWAAVYNVFAVLLASGALVKFRIPPAYAGLGEIVSVCPVIAAAVSLIWGRKSV